MQPRSEIQAVRLRRVVAAHIPNGSGRKSLGIVAPCLLAAAIHLAPEGFAQCVRYEEQRLCASDGAANDRFGTSVAVSGEFAVVGAPMRDDLGWESGAAYTFRFDGVQWVEQQILTAADTTVFDQFGTAVAIDGHWIAVGVPHDSLGLGREAGSVYLFRFDGTQSLSKNRSGSEFPCSWGRRTLPHNGRDTRPPPPRRLMGAGRLRRLRRLCGGPINAHALSG